MTKQEFMLLMRYPAVWLEWGFYPDTLFENQIAHYEPGQEQASEHYRNGAFHWWMCSNPDQQQLSKLIRLTFLDPDYLMGDDVRRWLRKCEHFGTAHEQLIGELAKRYPPPPFKGW